jgi:hypothetical protein
MEATDSWQLLLKTDIDKGFINNSDFVLQEEVHRAYEDIKRCYWLSNTILPRSRNCLLAACFEFYFDLRVKFLLEIKLETQILLVGTILSKTTRTLTLDTVNNLVSGNLYSKSQSSESSGLLAITWKLPLPISSKCKLKCLQ